ncbi:MAG: helix-turn-helix transcriptional regulator [Candidatus Solibacter usitatus]|nr:helix-turn-helix transcriptional regulator [Candidatus Solibacter usitatus]
MDVPLLIKHRLNELGLEQKALAAAAQVTESYISQLLARKKAPPAPGRTDIYEKIGQFLKLPAGELTKLAEVQRKLEIQKKVAAPPRPLFEECRGLVLRKCEAERREEVRRLFENEPFGEFERLITQKILDVAQGVAREELRSEEWLRSRAQLNGQSFEQVRVVLLEFLDTDIFHISIEGCVSFLDQVIASWDIDLRSFGMTVSLNRRLAAGGTKRFEFTEKLDDRPVAAEPGFEQFLADKSLSGDATGEEIEFLRVLEFKGRRPTPLYYYRELQNLRDALHFAAPAPPVAFHSSTARQAHAAEKRKS